MLLFVSFENKVEIFMHIYILTTSHFKEAEISKYFNNIGLKTTWIKSKEEILDTTYIVVREQTQLYNLTTQKPLKNIESCYVKHTSRLMISVVENGIKQKNFYKKATIKGYLFPLKKENSLSVYDWDDIFFPENSSYSYQQLKLKGVKNSARDLVFSLAFEDKELKKYIKIDYDKKVNLSFNPINNDQVIDFKPYIHDMFNNNPVYQLAYQNSFFNPLINTVLNNGLFIRRASNRSQKNYWLPGVNAGIPLTPKKDDIHELTFMFHDIMHFLFSDLFMDNDSVLDKKVYIISRMMSEAFTIILADMLFIHLLKKNNISYDFSKRKIYPLFENMVFDISIENKGKIKELLYASYLFTLKGEEKLLKNKVNDDNKFESFKEKYQPFFREDYLWTEKNAEHFIHNIEQNRYWLSFIKDKKINNIFTTSEFIKKYHVNTKTELFDTVFEYFWEIINNNLIDKKYDPVLSQKNAFLRYISGQLMIFYKYESNKNELFMQEIIQKIECLKNSDDLKEIQSYKMEILRLYNMYIDYLLRIELINSYKAEQYRNIYPVFDPFYVFYEKKEHKSFKEVFNQIFKE